MIVGNEGAVSALNLGVGEVVTAMTKMGNLVVEGEVVSTNRLGAVVRAGGKDVFLRDDLHLFVLHAAEAPPPTNPEDRIILDVDARVSARLAEAEDGDDADADSGDSEKTVTPSKSVDPKGLPQDIQQAILSSRDLTADQVNKVLAEISNAAMRSMKRIGVQEIEIYPIVAKIQDSVSGVFGFEPVKLDAKGKGKSE